MNDPLFIDFDGAPNGGKIPTDWTVMTPHVTSKTLQAAYHAYADFCANKRLSVAPTHHMDLVFPNGARVYMHSIFGVDTVYLWEAPKEEEEALPHGLLVVVPWHPPFIFRKDEEEGWLIAPDHIPQAVEPIYAYNSSEIVDGSAFYITPFVRNQKLLWDHVKRGAHDNGETPVPMPLNIRYGTLVSTFGKVAHDAIDDAIKAKGAILYEMEESPHILFDESDLLASLPTDSDTDARKASIGTYRRAAIGEYIYKYLFCSEELRRNSHSTYGAANRYLAEVIAADTLNEAELDQNSTFIGPTDRAGNLEEVDIDVTGSFPATDGASGLVAIRYWYTAFDFIAIYSKGIVEVRWGVRDSQTSIPESLKSRSLLGYTHVFEESASDEDVVENVVLLGGTDAVQPVTLRMRYSYPTSRYWRAGNRGVTFDPSSLYGSSFPANYYAQTQKIKDRRDSEVLMTPESYVDAELGWITLRLFDTAGSGALSGSYHTLTTVGQNNIDNDFANAATSTPFHPGSSLSSPADGSIPRTDYINLSWYAASQSGKMTAAIMSKKAKYSGTSSIVEQDAPCVNTVEYTYTSRVVIDYDSRSRFYAAIRVEVECSGMGRDDSTVGPRGYLTTSVQPSYTVKIYFESRWKDKDLVEILLVEATAQRPGFEMSQISHENPFQWPFDGAFAYPTYVKMPPVLAMPDAGVAQLVELTRHQGVNTNVCAENFQPAALPFKSKRGIEYSYFNPTTQVITPHRRYCPGMLYCRTFKLSDLPNTLWLLKATKCDATENDAGISAAYHYMPDLGAALEEVHHVELRDGAEDTWTDEIPQVGDTVRPANLVDRNDVKLYKV